MVFRPGHHIASVPGLISMHGRIDVGGVDGVDANIVRTELARQGLRQACHAVLRGDILAEPWTRPMTRPVPRASAQQFVRGGHGRVRPLGR